MRRFILCVSVWAGVIGMPSLAMAEQLRSLAASDRVGDLNVAELPALWHQWTAQFPNVLSGWKKQPTTDCAYQQTAPAVFSLEEERAPAPITKSCDLPAGQTLFMPLAYNTEWTPPGLENTCDDLLERVTFEAGDLAAKVTLDGTVIDGAGAVLIQSQACYDLFAAVPASKNAPRYEPTAVGGYWLALSPLPAGRHSLHVQAYFPAEGSRPQQGIVDVTYELNVK